MAMSETEQLALAQDIAEEVRRHGGQLQANHLPSIRPDVRKRLGDEKLLHFIGRFPDVLQIHDRHNGHVLSLTDSLPLPVRKEILGRASVGATCPQGLGERAVHALRQLDRELFRCGLREPPSAVDVAYLLHNGKLRRKIGAVVRFLPLTELIVAVDSEGSAEPGKGCPLSGHARTYAGYLLQFLRDRPEKYQLERGGRTLAEKKGLLFKLLPPWHRIPVPGRGHLHLCAEPLASYSVGICISGCLLQVKSDYWSQDEIPAIVQMVIPCAPVIFKSSFFPEAGVGRSSNTTSTCGTRNAKYCT